MKTFIAGCGFVLMIPFNIAGFVACLIATGYEAGYRLGDDFIDWQLSTLKDWSKRL